MDVFDMTDLLSQRAASGQLYLEFFEAPTMSIGVYELAAGSVDPQQPHTEDEVYYVVGGRGQVRIDGEDREISAGECGLRQAQVWSTGFTRSLRT